jgi:hypothetical protein
MQPATARGGTPQAARVQQQLKAKQLLLLLLLCRYDAVTSSCSSTYQITCTASLATSAECKLQEAFGKVRPLPARGRCKGWDGSGPGLGRV